MDEDDEIIEEIPLYLSKTLVDNVFIFQYPSKKTEYNLDSAEVIRSCMKPISQEVKLDIGLNTASKHYDSFKGEQFAIAADGQKHSGNEQNRISFRSGTMDRQTFISTRPMENANKYILGLYQDKEIHACPIKSILQMRPAFSYFDKSDKRSKEEKRAEANADMDDDELQQVTVTFANEYKSKTRDKQQKLVDESWCETMWYPKHSEEAKQERQKFFTTPLTNTSNNSLELSCDEYIKTLIPQPKDDENTTKMRTNVITKVLLSNMNLTDQIRTILKDVKVVQFNHLLDLLTLSISASEKVLRVLQAVGILIKGNWVVLSEILYPEQSVSKIHGVPADLMCRARDYVLYLLSKDEYIDRKKLTHITQIPAVEIKEILQSVAKLDEKKNWILLLPADTTFEKKYQELKQRQENYWKAKETQFQEMEDDILPKRTRKKSIRETQTK